jgi:DNA-binding response OmpR family regulator
LCSPLYQT